MRKQILMVAALAIGLSGPGLAQTGEPGEVGSDGAAALRGDDRGEPSEAIILNLPDAGVRDLQTFLTAAEFEAGPVDGVWGPQSRTALAA